MPALCSPRAAGALVRTAELSQRSLLRNMRLRCFHYISARKLMEVVRLRGVEESGTSNEEPQLAHARICDLTFISQRSYDP